jgi:hypothetical protein
VVLESVKFEGFVLSASTEYAYPRALPGPNAAVPRVLRNPRTLELNGWLLRKGMDGKPVTFTGMSNSSFEQGSDNSSEGSEAGSSSYDDRGQQQYKCVASFQVKLYARFRDGDATDRLTTFNKVGHF